MNSPNVILDCYTDEPSGYGTRPYIGTHQTQLSQALKFIDEDHIYLTIDDLRFTAGKYTLNSQDTDTSVINKTKNCYNSVDLLHSAKTIYAIMGCFVDYTYFSAVPPKSDEVYEYLKKTRANKVLFYVLGGTDIMPSNFRYSLLSKIFDKIIIGNTYRAVLENKSRKDDFLAPNYHLLSKICHLSAPILSQLNYPVIVEIETGTGCNRPTCSFCIESHRRTKISYREPSDIIRQITTFYKQGVRHFRLGRQPNIYHYQWQNAVKFETLLCGIREKCPDIEMLHIDNVNALDVVSEVGIKFTKLITKYCTSGNIAPFGIESFDPTVRNQAKIQGTGEDILKAIEIINTYGYELGKDGFHRFLPGINLIYGLPGQSEETHEINIRYLLKILEKGLMTRRLFFRKLTSPAGVTFDDVLKTNDDHIFQRCQKEITDNYVMPMQKLVFPQERVLRGFREVVFRRGETYLRILGTCSERAVVNRILPIEPYGYYDMKVIDHLGPREIMCEMINDKKAS